MKKILPLALLLAITTTWAQSNFNKQPGKKEFKKGMVTYESFTDSNGAVSYGFRINGLIVGPNMVLHTNGKSSFVNYNLSSQMDGTLIEMDKNSGTIDLITYRDGEKDGPSFKITNGKPSSSQQYKNGKIDPKGFNPPPPGKYALQKGDGKTGLTMEKYDKSYALGYFIHGYRNFPMIHVWNDGDSYYGQYMFGERRGFGVFFYKNGNKYVGYWDENYREGLGFLVDKNGVVIEKGYYDDGKLVTPL
ncbi:hypothetical protein SLW70_06680 [Flavobacterium sp. NG2]|uniref:hypothetical protein n=1 Tax=Flavobacterium TaxID=237 RepID=UPI001C7E13F7|nr:MULTISPECIES: hypothetical protein [unclassified Flavobacterium]WPR72807.1 hypothetical protein SLW70_06680 [Flavobacterium sp. NG2]